MRCPALTVVLLAFLLLVAPSLGVAQSSGSAVSQPTERQVAVIATPDEPGLVTRALAAVIGMQRKFHRQLSSALSEIRQEGASVAAWTLIVTSFLYGLFHAAGPGHGKAVITAYLVTHRQRIPRGVALAAAAAALQGITAIVLVLGLVELAGLASRDAQGAVRWAEQLSFALVAALGFYLLWRGVAGLRGILAHNGGSAHDHTHDHGHDHAHDHTHDHAHCGHAHMPTPAQTDAARDLRTAAGVVLSIGIRPCSGAVLVLAVANVFGILWAGVAAVAAMSVGTAIAVATLALIVVSARHWVSTVVTGDGTRLAMAGQTVASLGGAVILVLGLMLLIGSFGPAHPLGL